MVTCLGGGAGTGIAPVVASVSRGTARLTIAVAATPFPFEGHRARERAEQGLKDLEAQVDTLIHIPMADCARLFPPETRTSAALKRFDQFMAQSLRGLIEPFVQPAILAIDYLDLVCSFEQAGKGAAAIGIGTGEDRAACAVKAALAEFGLMLGGLPLKEARNVWGLIEGSASTSLHEVQEAMVEIIQMMDEDAHSSWAFLLDEEMEDKMRLTLLTSGH